MLRKILSVLAVMGLSLFGFAPAASAAAVPDCYVPATLGLTSVGGLDLIITGGNFGCDSADSVVTLNVTYGQASGLRHSAALKVVSDQLTANPDGDGNFSIGYTALQPGPISVSAVGSESVKAASAGIILGQGAGTNGGGNAGTDSGGGAVIVGGGSSGSTGSGGLAYTGQGQGSSGSAGTGGLAYTGASIAGPVIIGIAALLAGLSLLFFGTRGVARRKHAGSSSV